MVDSIKPTYRTVASPKVKRRTQEAPEVESHVDEKEAPSNWAGYERRRGGDRRNAGAGESKTLYEMRHSRGRRKTDQNHPRIETKV